MVIVSLETNIFREFFRIPNTVAKVPWSEDDEGRHTLPPVAHARLQKPNTASAVRSTN